MLDNLDSIKLYQKEISKIPPLSKEEERELLLDGSQKAKNKLIEANLRLVFPLAYHYQNYGVSFKDLIQEGNLGLIHAAEKFDVKENNRFCTYAIYWARQYMVRALANQGKTIRIPVHMTENIEKIRVASRDLTQLLGRKPLDKEIAERTKLTVKQVQEAKSYIIDMSSLDKKVGEDKEATIGELIEDEYFVNPEIQCLQEQNKDTLIRVLETLTPREADILKKRFGLIDGKTRTLEEIGKEYNLTRERMRQIESKALRKLRHPFRANLLKECYGY